MGKYMPNDLFNLCAITVAKLSHVSEQPSAVFAQELWNGYISDYPDDDVVEDWIKASEAVQEILSETVESENLPSVYTQLQFCFEKFNSDGTPKRKKLFGGTLFNKQKFKDGNRVSDFLRCFTSFYAASAMESLPPFPDGYGS